MSEEQESPTDESGHQLGEALPEFSPNHWWFILRKPEIVLGLAAAAAVISLSCLLVLVSHSSAHPGSGGEESRLTQLKSATLEVDAKVSKLRTRVAELEGARELEGYAHKAIAEGDRSSLLELHEYLKAPRIPALKEVADAEIIRVEYYYLTTRRFRGFPNELPTNPETDPIARHAQILLDPQQPWGVRAQVARLLGDKKKNVQAAETLARACETDSNLYVVQESILAFTRVTGFRSTGVFDSRSLNDWWVKNRANFE